MSTTSVERWRSELSRDDIGVIEHLAHGAMTRHGYVPSLPQLPRSARLVLSGRVAGRRVSSVAGDRVRRALRSGRAR